MLFIYLFLIFKIRANAGGGSNHKYKMLEMNVIIIRYHLNLEVAHGLNSGNGIVLNFFNKYNCTINFTLLVEWPYRIENLKNIFRVYIFKIGLSYIIQGWLNH